MSEDKAEAWTTLGCWTALIGLGLAFWAVIVGAVIWWLR